MPRRRPVRGVLQTLIALPLVLALPYACGGSGTETQPSSPADAGVAGYEDVIYEGAVTDEALLFLVSALEQRAPEDDPGNAPTLQSPTGSVPKSAIPTFTWSVGKAAGRALSPALLRWAEHDPDAPRSARRSAWLEAIGAERIAEAHGTPYTGTGTWAVFSSSSNPSLARVLTSKTSYTPTQPVWDRIAAAGTVTVTLIGASFVLNRIAAGGGPYKGSVSTFTVTN